MVDRQTGEVDARIGRAGDNTGGRSAVSFTVVLDDDPTGTQSATGVDVLLRWDTAAIVRVLSERGSVYLQTNSRAISEIEAVALADSIRLQIRDAERILGESILVVLRGDSTLRGHVFAESDVFAGTDGRILFVPAFPAGGRTTIGAVHRVVVDGTAIPVGETEFARDPVFGYRCSDLREWVREKGARASKYVPLAALRRSEGRAIATAVREAGPGDVILPDVETEHDLELVHHGLTLAAEAGLHVVVRSAATLAAICAGRLSNGYLARPIRSPTAHVLVVCGSHTSAASVQLAALLHATGSDPVSIPTDAAFADPEAAGRRAGEELRRRFQTAPFAVLCTERQRRAEDSTLAHGELVMRALMTAACAVAGEIVAVVSKGGITSAETARSFFAADRATVRGQIAPGISVWDFADGGTQVVVPGNVGGANTLLDVFDALGIYVEADR